MINKNKSIILGDGIDSAVVSLVGLANEAIRYTVDGVEYEGVCVDTKTLYPGTYGVLEIEVFCDTPNKTIVIRYNDDMDIIYAIGTP